MKTLPDDASADQSGNIPQGYYRRNGGMLHMLPVESTDKPAQKGLGALELSLELFCKAYVSSGDSFAAYKHAFHREGSKAEVKALLNQANVTERVQFLSNKRLELMQHSAQVDIDTLVRELEQARQLAIKNDEPAAAISATMGKAKLHGLLVDKREMAFKRPEDMSEAEILKALGFDTIEELMASDGQLTIEHQPSDEETIN